MLIAGWDKLEKPCLNFIDPSGKSSGVFVVAIGNKGREATAYLKKKYTANLKTLLKY